MSMIGMENRKDVHTGTLCRGQTYVMIEGLSRREAAKRFGIPRNTITKMLSFSVPPGYRRGERPASRMRKIHKKQRHTAHRIFERLRDEQGSHAGYTIVREYVAAAILRTREIFVPLSHRPMVCERRKDLPDIVFTGENRRSRSRPILLNRVPSPPW
jgi:transposase